MLPSKNSAAMKKSMTPQTPPLAVATFLVLVCVPVNALGGQTVPASPAQSAPEVRLSSDQASQLSLRWVDFLEVLAEVRALDVQSTEIGQMLIDNRYSANKLRSPLLGIVLDEEAYPEGSNARFLIEQLQTFRAAKLDQADEQFALLRKLAEATSPADLTSLPAEIAIHAGKVDELWRQLPLFAVLLGHVLTDDTRLIDGRLAYLRLTSQQRETLKQRLRKAFPDVAVTKGGFALEVSASLLYRFLDSGFRAADE